MPDEVNSDELWYVFARCTIRRSTIRNIFVYPEYVNAIKSYSGAINNEALYEIIKNEYVRLLRQGERMRGFRHVMNKVSLDVTGKTDTWREEVEEGDNDV